MTTPLHLLGMTPPPPKKPSRQRAIILTILALIVLAAIVLAVIVKANSKGDEPAPAPSNSPLDWPAPSDATDAATKAGLAMLGQEMLKVHYHAHLDVTVDGDDITVPGNLGVDLGRHTIAALHTHDDSGLIHIESGEDVPYTLGQVFAEWDQPLSDVQVGKHKLAVGEQLRIYVNGKLSSTEPSKLKLRSHDEILVWVGKTAEQPDIPKHYDFPGGT